MRYIIALVPAEKDRRLYIQAAREAFGDISDGYLLSENGSIPHVTLCSFNCPDSQKLEQIWNDVRVWDVKDCQVRFLGLMLKKGKTPSHHYSVGLSIARDSSILQLHHMTLNLLHSHGLESLNPSQDLYQPHLTLAGICWLPSEAVIISSAIDNLITIPSNLFCIALGRSDDIGQYLETLRQ